MPHAQPLRIAVATSGTGLIDLHFGQAGDFQVFDVGAGGAIPVGRRVVAEHAAPDENPRDTVCRILSDCAMLLVSKIGISPQEKLADAGIEASDAHAGQAIDQALAAVYAARFQASTRPLDASGFRLAHAMLRVTDMDRALAFYTGQLGMHLIERRDHAKNQFTQAYVGYGDSGMSLELVFNWNRETPYEAGESFGHIAIEVTDITDLCARLAGAGIPMPRPPRSQRHGERVVAFIEDPDGHRVELVQCPSGL